MIAKQVWRYPALKEKILSAVDTFCDPIRQTLSPRGGNVAFHDKNGTVGITNDGVTIARNISVEDEVENAVIEVMRHGALQTNMLAGDGTSTTTLWAGILIKEGLKLIENGMNPMDVKHEYEVFADKMVEALKKSSRPAKGDKDLEYVANISANNDSEVAKNVVRTLKIAGEDGLVFLEPSNTADTELVEDTGFHVKAGMFTPEFRNKENGFSASYIDVPVLITDKQIYHASEAETILQTVLSNGYKSVVIVAKDFVGEALPFFVTNHKRGVVNVLLIKEPNAKQDKYHVLSDLAVYLGGEVVSEKSGTVVDSLTIENFVIAKRVFADGQKTLISRDSNDSDKDLKKHIKALKSELKKLGSDETSPVLKELKERIASLTNGMVTIRIGGVTPIEVNERIYRYEDAVNATRVAMKDGYVLGGGLGYLRAFNDCKWDSTIARVFKKVAEANIVQIAENCGVNGELVLDNILCMPDKNIGFNARTMTYDDLLEVGVIDPFKVAEMVVRNSVSVASMIITARFFVLNKQSEHGKSKE